MCVYQYDLFKISLLMSICTKSYRKLLILLILLKSC